MSFVLRAAALFAALALVPIHLAAQGSGSIVGRVVDGSGAPLPRVLVAAGAHNTVTGADGRFVLQGVAAGEQSVAATSIGYTHDEKRVVVTTGEASTVVLRLTEAPVLLEGIDVLVQRRRVASSTRTTTELLEIPQNIQVVGQDVIRQQAALTVQDAIRNVSGITNAATDQGGYQYFHARGFALDRNANFRRNGAALFNWSNPLQENVEQVEVLKGPAGILFGDVEPGAVVNITTKRALPETYRRAELKVGEYGLYRPSLDVTGPVVSGGSLLYRLNASTERTRSFRDVVESESHFVSPVLTWLANDRTTVSVEGSWQRDDRVGDPGIISPDGTVDGLNGVPVTRFLGEPNARIEFEDVSVSLTVQRYLTNRWRVRHSLGGGEAEHRARTLYLGGVAGDQVTRTQYDSNDRFANVTGTLDVIGEVYTGGIRHQLLVGADWSGTRARNGGFQMRSLTNRISLGAPVYGHADVTPASDEWSPFATDTRRLGVNVQDQVTLLDGALHLLAGVRYNSYVADKHWYDTSARPESELSVEERAFSPRFGLVYQPAEWLSTYASYAESYLVNGFDWLEPTKTVPATTGTQYEVGTKANLLGGRLGLTVAAYQLTKDGVYGWAFYNDANPAPTPEKAALGWYTYSGATHRSRGAELDFHGRVSERLSVTGSAAYVQAEVVEDPAFTSGNRLRNTPRTSGSLWASYRPALLEGVEVGGGTFFRGEYFGGNDNGAGSLVPSSLTADVSAGYTLGRYRAQLNIRNVTNEVTYIGGFSGTWQPEWTRRAVLSLSATF